MSKPVSITRLDRSALELRRKASRCGDAAVARRLLAIALVLQGRSRSKAANAYGMYRQTLPDWVNHYNTDWVASLSKRRSLGRPVQLTAEQFAAFDVLVEQGPDLARDGVAAIFRRVCNRISACITTSAVSATCRLGVWSQILVVYYVHKNGGVHYGPGSPRLRHNDGGNPSSDTT